MKALRNIVDKIKPNFEEGGKFAKLHSTFDAFESFLFVPNTVTGARGAQVRDAIDMKRTMITVVIALLPAMLFGMWNVGFQQALSTGVERTLMCNFWYGFLKVLPIIVVSYVVGLSIEFGVAQARGHEVNEGFLVSGLLIPLIMPVGVPLWIVALATAFSVVFVKEVFGGTGMNLWNPALVARAFVFFAYPTEISGDKVWIAGLKKGLAMDGFSGATPLAECAASVDGGQSVQSVSQLIDSLPSFCDMLIGRIPGSIGETSLIAILIGAVILLATGIASWKIMVSVFAGGALMGLFFNVLGINTYMQLPFYYHFVMGGFAFGAVFMATDPVSAAQTETGKWIYGLLIGIFAVLLRVVNPAYPEGMMLSILLMNTFASLIDYCVVDANIRRRARRAQVKA